MAAQLLKNKTTVVWLGLIVATIISWQLGTHGDNPELATTIIMGIAFLKVWLVGMWFMELKDSPLPLFWIFNGYVGVVCLAVIIMYLAM